MQTGQMKRALVAFLFTTITITIPAFAAESDSQIQTAKTLLNAALESNDREKLDKAAAIFQTQWDKPGTDRASMVVEVNNTAQLYQSFELQQQSLNWWQKLSSIEPENWRAWAKIVQCSQALNDLKERDFAREKVLALAKQCKVEQKYFVREQFSSGDKKIMALEYFKPDSELGVMLAFRVSPDKAPDTLFRRYTLGEIESDTQIARELKEIGPNDHMYSIDGFNEGGQWLISMTTKMPSYEDLRALVIKDLSVERIGSQRR